MLSPWIREAVTEIAPLCTTGGTLWAAARHLVDYLEAMEAPLALRRPGLRILELGSGVGYVGVVLARNLPDAGCIATSEQEADGGLAHLQHNLDLNRERFGGRLNPRLCALPCDWTVVLSENAIADATLAGEPWDLIVGSDLVYNDAGVFMLPRVVRALLRPGTRFLYAHTKYRYEMADIDFFAELARVGLACREVRAPGTATPPPSPPPMTSIFNEQRCAILEMCVGGHWVR